MTRSINKSKTCARVTHTPADTVLTHRHIVFHDQNAAQLAICDGLAGDSRTRCRTSGPTTIGERGSAKFTLTSAAGDKSRIRLSKARWEECVRAARDKCPTGSLSGTCLGGELGGGGDVLFTLESTMRTVE